MKKSEVRSAFGEQAAVTLRRTSRELRRTIGMVEDLEQVVSVAITVAGRAEPEHILELQKLDHIQQKILGVADFIDALTQAMPPDWLVDAKAAARCVLLAELGARLGDGEVPIDPPIAKSADGCELF